MLTHPASNAALCRFPQSIEATVGIQISIRKRRLPRLSAACGSHAFSSCNHTPKTAIKSAPSARRTHACRMIGISTALVQPLPLPHCGRKAKPHLAGKLHGGARPTNTCVEGQVHPNSASMMAPPINMTDISV